jgi:hypothetical protein
MMQKIEVKYVAVKWCRNGNQTDPKTVAKILKCAIHDAKKDAEN